MVAVVSLACLTTLAPLPSEQLDIHKSQLVVLAITSIPRQLLSTLYIIHTSRGDCCLPFYHWICHAQPLALPCIYRQYISYARCFSFGASLFCKLASYYLPSVIPKKVLVGVSLAISRDCLFGAAERKWAIYAGQLSAPFALRCWSRGS